uniref:G-protein coupled receptors family 1 profile domain-containing protein n=1 Tax=Strigops habroptila TaxID=2489341 RepID=A0A672TUY8_STRHB
MSRSEIWSQMTLEKIRSKNNQDREWGQTFFNNWLFLLCASTLEFFVPLLVVTYFNVHIFHNIQRRQWRVSTQDCERPRTSSLSWRSCLLLRQEQFSPPLETEDTVSSPIRLKKESLVTESSSPTRGNSVMPENDFSVSLCSRSGAELQQDKKTAKSLAIIVCVFCIHKSLYETTFWLLWLNSSLNPFLYPLCHVKFQMAFMKIHPQKFVTLRSGYF